MQVLRLQNHQIPSSNISHSLSERDEIKTGFSTAFHMSEYRCMHICVINAAHFLKSLLHSN